MSLHLTRAIQTAGLVFALLLLGLWFSPIWAASNFVNEQKASLVLGQSAFNTKTLGTTANALESPYAIAFDPTTDKVFVADSYNHRVLRYASFDSLSNGASAEAVLGQTGFGIRSSATSINRMKSPQDVLVDANGTLWVADTGNHRVLRFNNASTITNGANADGVLGQTSFDTGSTSTTTSKTLNFPAALAISDSGTLWVGDGSNFRVLRFDNAASKANGADANGVLGFTSFSGHSALVSQSRMSQPTGLALDSNGTLWVAVGSQHRIMRFDNAASKANGANADAVLGQTDFVSSSSGLSQSNFNLPVKIDIDSDGALWVADSNNHRVLRFDDAANKANGADSDGVIGQEDYTSNTSGLSQSKLHTPVAAKVDSSGSLWVVDFNSHRILRFSNLQTQTISFDALADKEQGDAPFSISATASSGLDVTFASTTPSVCSVNDTTVTLVGGGTCTIQASQAGDKTNYTAASSVEQSFSVKPFAPITWNDPSAISYGTALSASQLNATSSISGTFSYSPALGTILNAGSQTLTVTFSPNDTANYAPVQKTVPLTVTPAQLNAVVSSVNRNYGQANPSFSYSINGFVNGENASVVSGEILITTTATISSTVGSYPIVGSGLSASNYTINYINGTLNINKVPLSVIAPYDARLYGANNPTFTANYSGFVLGETVSNLGGTLSITSTATASSPVGVYLLNPSGLSSNNYTINYHPGQLTVIQAPLTITAQNASKVVNTANPSFGVNYSGFVNGETVSDLSGSLVITSTATASSPVGSYPIVPSGLSSSNYEIDFVNGTLSVTKAPLTITAQNASRLVNSANPSFAVNYSGFVNGEDENELTGTLTITTTADLNSPAGIYPIIPSGLSSSNYEINFVNGSLVVDPEVAISWASPSAIVYGTALSASQLNASANISGTFSYQPALGSLLPAGTHTITATFTPNDNRYSTVNQTMLLTVNKAPLIITAQNASRMYGAANPSFSVNYSGFVNAEDESVLTGSLAFNSANASSTVGNHPIVASGLTSGNYALSFVDGTLTITKAPLTITAQNASRTYGAANPTFTANYSGFVNGENASVLGGSLVYSSANASSAVGTYPITPNGLTSNNYAISFVDGSLTITKAPLTITAQNVSREQGAANPSFTVNYSGFVNGEDENVLGGSLIYSSANTSSAVGSYPIVASGLTSNNYTITFVNGTLSVTAKPATQWQTHLPFVAK